MTLLDERPTTTQRHRRSWRDLPASPPVGTVLAPPDPATQVPVAPIDVTAAIPVPPPPAGFTGPAGQPASEPRRSRKGLVIGAVAATVLLTGAVTAVALQGNDDSTSTESTPTVTVPETGNGTPAASSPAAVAAALGPAVVQIELSAGGAQGGVGSGVIYDTSGLVLTAHHVVAANDEVTVRTADDRTFTGRVVGRSPERDLAVVALDGATDLTAATIAEPGTVEVGEPAIALGSPFGFQQSVTAGIISGLDRELDTPAGKLSGLIQTDAPINPGNSGGPLADAEARVIGINTAIASLSGGNDGVGFAVPVEDASALLDEVQTNGGIDAPTIPAPEDQGDGGIGGLIPGLDELIPGLDELIPDLGNLPSLDELLQDFLGGLIPDEVGDFFDDFLGGGDEQDQTPGGGS